ncbi:sigma-54-dependent Fis family transcriptional regulator [Hymenobacter negativus]|uniref:Sigma 54-interacting transcriptional regulator n=1 Tax=Hymenobacter negativus TaxID=2795026 RepID=A0ABS0Q806_9BACT|nr:MULTISPECIES: sigma 54-interacting transcriptional regulator [Bacteria]MBH8558809.1 sigma 54-interacting transcriptional regulator [Hymenobacter negativus]MBH8570345.1 sigma 54-interacting transcriptional regulator [Hymenobacter negativus]MBR7210084.1 sigma 54-interacting transcriptional regulator [Microvirga sp. STS02]
MPTNDENLLLHLNEAIATIRDKDQLFKVVTTKLRLIFPFDFIGINVFDKELQMKRLFLRDYYGTDEAPVIPAGLDHFTPIAGSPIEKLVAAPRVQQFTPQQYLADYPNYAPFNKFDKLGVKHITAVPLHIGGLLTGFLTLASRRVPNLTAADEILLGKLGSLIAVAVANTLAFEEVARREQERTLQLSITNALLSIKQREPLFRAVAEGLSKVVPFDYFGLRVQRAGRQEPFEGFAEFSRTADDLMAPMLALDPNRTNGLNQLDRSAMYHQLNDLLQTPGLYTADDFRAQAQRYPLLRQIYEEYGTRAMLIVPIWQRTDGAAVLILASSNPLAFRPEDLDTVVSLAPQIALALENLFAFEQIEELKAHVEQERTYLVDEINTSARFGADSGAFVGSGPALQRVQLRISQVAPTDTTVLISGETGTGKELVARELHNASPRHARALIKLNCAALPAQLIESELFGHEKGAFTGAVERRIGKFELANGGSIFLDEIGELPLDLQAKLLRVLQEREFERLGGTKVLHSDARVIAATNRVLADEVAAGRFRADLYYRLNVFPIELAPLRERREDIEPLLRHFVQRLSKRLGKPIRQVRPTDLAALQAYSWPGNIRELEHVLEQSIIVSQGQFLEFAGFAGAPLMMATTAAPPAQPAAPIKTLKEQERDHILAALTRTGGRVSGAQGAALLLDINPKTLEARMKKLGIRRTVGVEG